MPRNHDTKEPTEAQLAARAAGAERLRAAAAARKAQPVRSTRNDLEAAEQPIAQEKPRVMRSTGPAREALDPPVIEPVEHMPGKSKAETLAFMEEMITVIVHDTTDPTEDPIPEVINGGDRNRQYFIRGQEQTVKRKYVEVLARARKVSRGNEKFTNAVGDDDYRYPSHTALRYPFTVTHDPNPRGREWLKKVLSEG